MAKIVPWLQAAARQGKELIVLFHFTADTTWSNLPLAAGLASDPDGESLYPLVPGGSASTNSRCAAVSTSHVQAHRQYKSDQVHVRDLLERLAH
jgi:hypothetical protein